MDFISFLDLLYQVSAFFPQVLSMLPANRSQVPLSLEICQLKQPQLEDYSKFVVLQSATHAQMIWVHIEVQPLRDRLTLWFNLYLENSLGSVCACTPVKTHPYLAPFLPLLISSRGIHHLITIHHLSKNLLEFVSREYGLRNQLISTVLQQKTNRKEQRKILHRCSLVGKKWNLALYPFIMAVPSNFISERRV